MSILKTVRDSPWVFRFYLSVEAGLAGLASYLLGIELGNMLHAPSVQIGGLWCMISSLVVLQSLLQETKQAAVIRIVGSFLGALITAIVCGFWGYGYWQLLLVIFISIYLMNILSREQAARLSSTTAGVIVVIGIMHPDAPAWANSLARFVESLMGVSMAVFVVMVSERLGLRQTKKRQT